MVLGTRDTSSLLLLLSKRGRERERANSSLTSLNRLVTGE